MLYEQKINFETFYWMSVITPGEIFSLSYFDFVAAIHIFFHVALLF